MRCGEVADAEVGSDQKCEGVAGGPHRLPPSRKGGIDPMTTKMAGGQMAATYGYVAHKDSYAKRLRRIEGQVRRIAKMIEEDKYCIDVLTQISAASRALRSVALNLLDEHLDHCVSDAITEGGDEAEVKLAEASAAIARLVRS
jgi:CsoR family transcriptional regulator, copper-sensing transcriptional repressor